jgi:hypothetical protein
MSGCRGNGNFNRLRLANTNRLRRFGVLRNGKLGPTLWTYAALSRQELLDVKLVTVGAVKTNTHSSPKHAPKYMAAVSLVIISCRPGRKKRAGTWAFDSLEHPTAFQSAPDACNVGPHQKSPPVHTDPPVSTMPTIRHLNLNSTGNYRPENWHVLGIFPKMGVQHRGFRANRNQGHWEHLRIHL